MPDAIDYVFGYASLVGLHEAYSEDVGEAPQPGRLRGFRRRWGVAMNNWEGGDDAKHWLDRATGERPRIRVAYLDLYEDADCAVNDEDADCAVNGLALPVDHQSLEDLDAREVNYRRVDVSAAFEPAPRGGAPEVERALRVFAYVGLDAARERCRLGAEEGNTFVATDYVATVRRAFETLEPDALAEFDCTTDPCPFPERDLRVVHGDIAGLSPL